VSKQSIATLCLTALCFAGAAMPLRAADEKTVELAKKEGRVSFYTSMGADESKMVADAFQTKYPAIKVEITRLGSEKLLQRILNESRAGSYLMDAVTNSGMEIQMLSKLKLLARHIPPEFASFVPESRDSTWGWADMYSNIRLVAYNTRSVTKEKVPRRYEDLLDPVWKSQIGFPEGQYSWFATMMKVMGETSARKFFQGLSRQELNYRNSQVLVTQFVAAGEFSLGFVYDTQVLRFKKRGAPIDVAPMPFVTQNIHPLALGAQAPHPNAAKVFIDYVLSKEGQTLIKNMGRVISRSDIPQDDFAKARIVFDDPTIVDRLNGVIDAYKKYFH
jgi:ABC-type Fe3+ transport system substrate-binding protein